jgi:hypothetical protein
MALFQAEFRGLVEYYRLAYNLHRLTTLDGVMEQSLSHFAGGQAPDIRTQGLQALSGDLPDERENLQGPSSGHRTRGEEAPYRSLGRHPIDVEHQGPAQ